MRPEPTSTRRWQLPGSERFDILVLGSGEDGKSNFMIGVTATASAGIYLTRGYIDPALAMPVMLGVLVGAALGTRILVTARAASLRVLLAVVMMAPGAEMIVHGLAGRI